MKLKEGQKLTLIIVLIFILVGLFYYLMLSGFSPKAPPISRNSILEIPLFGDVAERKAPDPISEMLVGKVTSIQQLIFNIRKAKADKKIKGIILRPGFTGMGWGKAEELRDALIDFKESGKPVYVFAEVMTNTQYYVATVADTIISIPSGILMINGLLGGSVFLKGTLDKLGIKAQFIAYGKYKNAPDMFTRDRMSDAQREVVNSLLDDYYSRFLNAIAQSRNLGMDRARAVVDKGFLTSPDAYKEGLLDTMIFYNDFKNYLKKKFGKRLRFVSLSRYSKVPFPGISGKQKQIAVIYGVGTIVSGSEGQFGQDGLITSEGMANAIRKAAKNDKISAIILRIDSPGGSGMASEIIWREVIKAREKKPVIVSISDLAASGGYYISMAADSIIAHPSSIVGSIGVFMGKFIMKGLYKKIGMTKEEIKRGKNADLFSEIKMFNPQQEKMMRQYIMDFYRDFVQKVADGRGMTYEEVDRIAQGRVWTGEQGLKIGLVDKLGGLFEAVQVAKKMMGIPLTEKVKILTFPKPKSFWERLIESTVNSKILTANDLFKALPSQAKSIVRALPYFKTGEPLFLVPYLITIQ